MRTEFVAYKRGLGQLKVDALRRLQKWIEDGKELNFDGFLVSLGVP